MHKQFYQAGSLPMMPHSAEKRLLLGKQNATPLRISGSVQQTQTSLLRQITFKFVNAVFFVLVFSPFRRRRSEKDFILSRLLLLPAKPYQFGFPGFVYHDEPDFKKGYLDLMPCIGRCSTAHTVRYRTFIRNGSYALQPRKKRSISHILI